MTADRNGQPTGFSTRLQTIRRRRGWSEQDLARRAGVSAKTIRNIESGKQLNPLEHTRIKLAEALGVVFDELWQTRSEVAQDPVGDDTHAAEPATSPRGRHDGRRWATLGLLAILLLILGVIAAWALLRPSGPVIPRLAIETGNLVARAPNTGQVVWRLDGNADIRFFVDSPWDDGTVLVGLGGGIEDGGRLYRLERITGREIWRREVDLDHVIEAFGEDDVEGAGFLCSRVSFPDLDGDGECEIAAEFIHRKWFPYAVVFMTRDGDLLGQYDHRGHIYASLVCDLNRDGRQEVLFAGTNNAKSYQSGSIFMLDGRAMSGASYYAGDSELTSLPDSAAVRVAFASFGQDFLDCIGIPRLMSRGVEVFETRDGEMRVSVDVGASSGGVIITLDEDLHPLGILVNDHFPIEFADCQGILTDQTDGSLEIWLDRWLDKAVRFEAGHWQGHSGEQDDDRDGG